VLATLPLPGAGHPPLPGAWSDLRAPAATVLLAYLPTLVLQVLTTGVAEEPGWRDFAQPRLQSRFGPLTGALILGPLWGLGICPCSSASGPAGRT